MQNLSASLPWVHRVFRFLLLVLIVCSFTEAEQGEASVSTAATTASSGLRNRWVQLLMGVIAMMAIANLQYAWTVFVNPMQKQWGWSLAAIQGVFAMFILAETWLVPFEGYLVDRFGPRTIVSIGAVLVGLSWVGSGLANSIEFLYVSYVIGGVGAGAVYGASVGNAMKWFPDHRGLASGFTAGGYGIGTALTVWPIQNMINASGYQQAFIVFGIIQGIVCLAAAQTLSVPDKGWRPAGWDPKAVAAKRGLRQPLRDSSPIQMVKTSHFWLLYVMFVMIGTSGLMATAQVGPIAKFYKVDNIPMAFGMTALVMAVEVDRLLNGFTRPFWGWVSDHIGRENTMTIAFTLQGIFIFLWMNLTAHPVAFVVLTGVVFFTWGEIFSLFPATVGDLFGTKYATTNYGILYTAKGVASIFAGPLAAMLFEATNSWTPIFWITVVASLITAALAYFVLKPLTAKYVRVVEAPKPAPAIGGSE